jgi:toxin ParE1/3/4
VRVRRHSNFIDDLSDAYAYLAERNASAADRLLDEVGQLIELLGDFPQMGRVRRNLRAGLRSFRVRGFQYVIFYRVMADEIILMRILHGARRIRPRLFQD